MYENLTPNAKRLIGYISPIYKRSLIMQSVFEAIAEENNIEAILTDDILNQLFPQTATWAISLWEEAVLIKPNPNEDLQVRRARVISTLQQETTLTPYVLSNVVKNFTGMESEIIEDYGNYMFYINIDGNSEKYCVDFNKLIEQIYILKPAHLGYGVNVSYNVENNFFIGSTLNNCNVYTLFPKEPTFDKIDSPLMNTGIVSTLSIYKLETEINDI